MSDTGVAPNKVYQRTDGVRTGSAVNQQAQAAGAKNTAAYADARENDIATALNNRIMRDGGNQAAANLPMGDINTLALPMRQQIMNMHQKGKWISLSLRRWLR